MPGSPAPSRFKRAGLRKLLYAVLPTDSELNALCVDFFPSTARAFSSGQDRIAKENLLLEREDAAEIVEALQAYSPERFKKHQNLLTEEPNEKGSQPTTSIAASEPVPVNVRPSTVASRENEPSTQPTADVVIITALKEEYDEALKVSEGARNEWLRDERRVGFEVACRSFQTHTGEDLRVAMTWAPRMRGVATAETAVTLLHVLRPSLLAMCGVCAGRRGKVSPGDVILADLVYSYNMGATQIERDEHGVERKRFQADTEAFPLNQQLLRRAQAFAIEGSTWTQDRPSTLAAQCDWLMAELHAGRDPLAHPERSQRCSAWGAALERLKRLGYLRLVPLKPDARKGLRLTKAGSDYIATVLIEHANSLPAPPPWRLHLAPIATGPDVMRDPELFDKLSQSMRKVLGVEMEAAALALAAHSNGLPWIVMKGVMDHTDHDKDDLLKAFAARASAECLIRFLRETAPIWRPVSPSDSAKSPQAGPGLTTASGAASPSPTEKAVATASVPAMGPPASPTIQHQEIGPITVQGQGNTIVIQMNSGRDAPAIPRPALPSLGVPSTTASTAIAQGAGHASPAAPANEAALPVMAVDLSVLIKKLEEVLRRSLGLCTALQALGYAANVNPGTERAKAIATALMERQAGQLLDDLDTLCSQDASLQSAVRVLLVHVLPLACDWQELLRRAEAAERTAQPLELPLRTMTLAEVINAGVDRRGCEFVGDDVDLQGVAHVPLPAVAYAPIFDTQGRHVAQNVLSNLWREQQVGGASLPSASEWKKLAGSATNERQFSDAAEHEINKKNRKRNRYLLFMDDKLARDGFAEAEFDARWAVVCKALRADLPGLRLIRLKGRDDEWKSEYPLISSISQLHNT